MSLYQAQGNAVFPAFTSLLPVIRCIPGTIRKFAPAFWIHACSLIDAGQAQAGQMLALHVKHHLAACPEGG